MRSFLKKVPVLYFLYSLQKKMVRASRRVSSSYYFRKRLAETACARIVIGASSIHDPGWIPTEAEFLNLLRPGDWEHFFQPNASIDVLLAEHVWEHLTPHEGLLAAQVCFRYLKPGGYIRIAVPDGLHPNPHYIEEVKAGGIGPHAADHKVLYNYKTLQAVFEHAGFTVILYEYFDEAGNFHYHEWDPQGGTIHRSKRFDKRNKDGALNYTSIVLDALKEKAA